MGEKIRDNYFHYQLICNLLLIFTISELLNPRTKTCKILCRFVSQVKVASLKCFFTPTINHSLKPLQPLHQNLTFQKGKRQTLDKCLAEEYDSWTNDSKCPSLSLCCKVLVGGGWGASHMAPVWQTCAQSAANNEVKQSSSPSAATECLR